MLWSGRRLGHFTILNHELEKFKVVKSVFGFLKPAINDLGTWTGITWTPDYLVGWTTNYLDTRLPYIFEYLNIQTCYLLEQLST